MKRFDKPILVTRPFQPDLDEFKAGLDEVWRNRWFTNNGPMVQKFHKALAGYLNVPETNLALFANGTLALQLGFKAMGVAGGEVITTPFTSVATSHAIRHAGATPVFADIDPETLCLDPVRVESLISPRTKAIVPVHVYGNVCDIAGFDRLSEKYGIPVIYDAAHAFGVTDVARRGALSMFSFHATKIFHSCEGGCLVFQEAALQDKLFSLRNLAFTSETACTDVGFNARMNELQALMGLGCLRHIDELIASRQAIYSAYAEVLGATVSVRLIPHSVNKAYIPVLFNSAAIREKVYAELKEKCNVFPRRYFYPLLIDFPPYNYARGTCPVAQDAASRVLALPAYYGLSPEDVKSIAEDVVEIVG